MSEDTKDLLMAGCQVHLTFHALADGRWTVLGIVRCGVESNQSEQSVVTEPFPSREEAEQDALSKLGNILGHNIDRSSSRVKNYGPGGGITSGG